MERSVIIGVRRIRRCDGDEGWKRDGGLVVLGLKLAEERWRNGMEVRRRQPPWWRRWAYMVRVEEDDFRLEMLKEVEG